MSDEPSILSRWSARKRAVAAEDAEASVAEPRTGETSEDVGARAAELEANRRAAEAVDLDSLDRDSDLSVFLREGVPELLRKAALQKLWRSNPVFANLDELVDYGEDFGRKDLIMETFTSAWQAGRGYLDAVDDTETQSGIAADSDLHSTDVSAVEDPEGNGAAEDPEPVAEAAEDTEEQTEPPASAPPSAPDTQAPPVADIAEAPPARRSLRARLAGPTGSD